MKFDGNRSDTFGIWLKKREMIRHFCFHVSTLGRILWPAAPASWTASATATTPKRPSSGSASWRSASSILSFRLSFRQRPSLSASIRLDVEADDIRGRNWSPSRRPRWRSVSSAVPFDKRWCVGLGLFLWSRRWSNSPTSSTRARSCRRSSSRAAWPTSSRRATAAATGASPRPSSRPKKWTCLPVHCCLLQRKMVFVVPFLFQLTFVLGTLNWCDSRSFVSVRRSALLNVVQCWSNRVAGPFYGLFVWWIDLSPCLRRVSKNWRRKCSTVSSCRARTRPRKSTLCWRTGTWKTSNISRP